MMNLILFGPPGSGKGTQSELLIKKYGLIHLSTGDLLRKERKEKTVLGLEAEKFIDQGKLVPDEVVIGMIKTAIDNNKDSKGFLFDGFPRTIAQAKALDDLLTSIDEAIEHVLFLKVDDEELIKRLLKRGETSGRSDDANEEILKNRLLVYKNETLPVADYYSQFNKVIEVDGIGTVEEIFGRISSNISVTID